MVAIYPLAKGTIQTRDARGKKSCSRRADTNILSAIPRLARYAIIARLGTGEGEMSNA